jgi:acylglycerol lipase
VVLAHGLSEHSGRYEHVAEAFNARGYSFWALDHRGHGKSAGDRAYIEDFEYLVADLHTLIRRAGEELPDRRPFLLGHSMGGCVATGYARRRNDELAGLILSNPLATIKTAPGTALVSQALSRVLPRLGVYSVDVDGISKDPEEVRKYVEDPLNFHEKVPVRTVAQLAREVEHFPRGVAAITVPTLIMYSTTDPIVASSGSEMLAERIGSDEVTLRNWEGLRHEILNEPERDQVIAEMLDWLDARA